MLEWLEVECASLKSFPMEDPSRRRIPVYLPPQYSSEEKTRYPLVFVLAGWGSRSWKLLINDSAFGKSLPEELDEMILKAEMPPCIVAFPDACSKLGFSQYINSKSLGNYQDYVCDDLVQHLESNFRLIQDPAFRAVTGHSSGGFGALWIGFQRPDRFQHILASAADSCFEISILSGLPHVISELDKAGGVENFVREFLEKPHLSLQSYPKFLSMMTLSLAACYAPNPDVPVLLGDLFFDHRTGEIIPEIWQKYTAWDPVQAVEKHLPQIRKLKTLILECGLQDEYAAQLGHRQISSKLNQAGIAHILEEYPGRHSGQNWRYASRIKKLVEAIHS